MLQMSIAGVYLVKNDSAELGGAIPPRRDVIRPEHRRRTAVVERGARQTEVADLELTVGVGKMFFGLRSRWYTLAVCTYFNPRSSCEDDHEERGTREARWVRIASGKWAAEIRIGAAVADGNSTGRERVAQLC